MSQAATSKTSKKAIIKTSHHDPETNIYVSPGDELPISEETDDEVCCLHTGKQGETPIWIPKGKVVMTTSDHFEKMVVWGKEGWPFVCVEPWVGGALAIENPQERIDLKPGEEVKLEMILDFYPNKPIRQA